jgi:hypothetical protein
MTCLEKYFENKMRQQAEKDIQIQENSKVSIKEIRMNREYYDKMKLKESVFTEISQMVW